MIDRKWWLVIAGCATHAVNTGFSYFGMSAFFPSFEREFGWSRTAISGAFSLARIESGLLGPLEGYLTDRVGSAPDALYRSRRLQFRIRRVELGDFVADALRGHHCRHRARFQPGLQHAHQRPI